MRVLDTATGQFVGIDPRNRKIKYAVLSHTWRRQGEQTYQQLKGIQSRHTAPSNGNTYDHYLSSEDDDFSDNNRDSDHDDSSTESISDQPLSSIWDDTKLSSKIREACRVARKNGYRYLWIDSCCIDKTSSSELSESINSMYQWYSLADVCYAFLADVPALEDHQSQDSHFRRSRWFTRGWTLQELIAPLKVVFIAKDWTTIGSKFSLADLITEITTIDHNALLHIELLDEFSVAQRLSWASERDTTRVEDRAYSLLGIFDINMPTLYGEGNRAFRRLQEEIMRRTPDQTLFAWSYNRLPDPSSELHDPEAVDADTDKRAIIFHDFGHMSFLAPSLDAFRICTGVEAISHDEVVRRLQLLADNLPTTDYDFTPYGVRVQLPVIPLSSCNYFPRKCMRRFESAIPISQWYLVILGCGHRDFPGHLMGRVCYTLSSGSSVDFVYTASVTCIRRDVACLFNLLPISRATITRLHSSPTPPISLNTLYMPQPQRDENDNDTTQSRREPHETIRLVLPKKTRDALFAQGYTTTLDIHPTSHSVVLSHDTHTISIDYVHTLEGDGRIQKLTMEAHVKTSGAFLCDTPRNPVGVSGMSASSVDCLPWADSLGFKSFGLNAPELAASTLQLGLIFATTNHYLLSIRLYPVDLSLYYSPVIPMGPNHRCRGYNHSIETCPGR